MHKTTTLSLLLAAAACAGCGTLDTAGQAAYSVKPVMGSDGKPAGMALDVKDGKEFGGRAFTFSTDGMAYQINVQEGASKAFKGQGIAAKALSVLPVTGLQDLVK